MRTNKKIAALLSLILLSAATYAAVHQRHTIHYYSDSTKTTLVGITITTCQANTISDGQVTPYFNIESVDCSSGGGGWPDDPYPTCPPFNAPPGCP